MTSPDLAPSLAPDQIDQQGSKYDRLVAKARAVPSAVTVVVYPCDESSLRGAMEAAKIGIIKPVLVGPAKKIADLAATHQLSLEGVPIVDEPDRKLLR